VLKAPSHLGALAQLFAEYPDARVVVTHRDPLAVLPSVASILYATAWVRSDAVEAQAVLGWFTPETCLALLDAMSALRDTGAVPAGRFCDVRFGDLMAKPIETLAAVYERFGIPLRAEAETRMRAYLAGKPRHRHGVHRYAFENTGRVLGRERERFRGYQERYGVASEA